MGKRLDNIPTKEIRKRLILLNFLALLVIISLLLVVLRYTYAPLRQLLDFIPEASMSFIIAVTFGAAAIAIYISVVLSREVVQIIEDYSERLDKMLDITKDLREEIYGDILLDKIMSSSLAITRSDAGSILLLDGDNLVFKIVKGEKGKELIGKAIPKDTGIGGWVLKHDKPVLVENVKADERYNARIDELTGYQTSSMLCAPLKTKSSVIGVIELLNKKHGFYGERDVEIISYLAGQAAISIENTKFYEDQRNYEIHLTDILLDVIDRFMPEKNGHSKRVAKYANIIAKAVNMPADRQRRLYFASLLHDIGFLRIPYEKVFEKDVYMLHPETGYDMLQPISFYKDIAPFILYHHERYDGQGYPKGLKGTEIPLESRIIFIAEAFDSMVSRVSYRISVNYEIAVSELIKNKGTQFDPELVDRFLDNIQQSKKAGALPLA